MSTESALISIVEDDESVRASLRRLLRSFGYAVEAFASATEFLASPRLTETDCLITDINMPAMSGLELFQRLIAIGRPIPTILITAYPDEAAKARAIRDGAFCYLTKPFDDEMLLRCVRLAIDGAPPPTDSP